MILHTIGDCHADAPWLYISSSDTQFNEIDYNGIFAFTMAWFGTGKKEVIDITKSYSRISYKPTYNPELRAKWQKEYKLPYDHYFNIKDGDAVLFSLGEIECRLHFAKPEYITTWRDLVDEIVPKYFEAIKVNVESFNNLHTMVHNIIPGRTDSDFKKYCDTYLREGTQEHRKEICLYVNNKLKEYCEKYNYIFFDVYDKYCDDDGFLLHEYSDDCTHIKDPIHYIEFLNNLKIFGN